MRHAGAVLGSIPSSALPTASQPPQSYGAANKLSLSFISSFLLQPLLMVQPSWSLTHHCHHFLVISTVVFSSQNDTIYTAVRENILKCSPDRVKTLLEMFNDLPSPRENLQAPKAQRPRSCRTQPHRPSHPSKSSSSVAGPCTSFFRDRFQQDYYAQTFSDQLPSMRELAIPSFGQHATTYNFYLLPS